MLTSKLTPARILRHPKQMQEPFLSNSDIAELLALAAETAKMPLQKALRRASRKVFMWEEEAALLVREDRSLTELPGVGPSLDRVIRRWIESRPIVPSPPEIRKGFLTVPEARATIAKHSSLRVKGDLQMHIRWSDGSGSVEEMARAASNRGYEYIAITDHSRGLKIAGGITEDQLQRQAVEIEEVNAKLQAESHAAHGVQVCSHPKGSTPTPRALQFQGASVLPSEYMHTFTPRPHFFPLLANFFSYWHDRSLLG
jgi:hypothetical protein